ncbi:MAG: hypothetical protein HFJ99_08350 [Eubacterium sp.]|nr:hypothetical protein [Eubacterium sp.]
MKKTNINYPYPVLNSSNEDYIECFFNIVGPDEVTINGDNIEIKISYNLQSNGLAELIQENKANVVLYCESVEAEYRNIKKFPSNSNQIEFTINKNEISKNLEIRGYVVSLGEIYPFRLDEHNYDLFGGVPFKIRKGDILAISNDFLVYPIKYYDPLANRPSIFSIRRGSKPNEEIYVDIFLYDKITVFLNDEIYNNYSALYQEAKIRTILSSMFAASVLIDVLSYIKNGSEDDIEDIKDKKWYQVINSRLDTLSIDLKLESSLTKVANIVLPHIYKEFVDSFKNAFESLIPEEDN